MLRLPSLMTKRAALCLYAAGTLVSCGQNAQSVAVRALGATGDASSLCLQRDEQGQFTVGRPITECPDDQRGPAHPEQRRLFALATQPESGEVAVLDFASEDRVLDTEPSQPGFSFLPVRSSPDQLVSLHSGAASFVSVLDPTGPGIFGLPSSCIQPRQPEEPLRDIRSWPACELPVAPGAMVELSDPAWDHDDDPETPDWIRTSCDANYQSPEALTGASPGATRDYCPADLAPYAATSGRPKLLVALPELGELWLLDAQELLDRTPGSYAPCSPEQRIPLGSYASSAQQVVPPSLQSDDASCLPPPRSSVAPMDQASIPSDFALDDTSRLFVADRGVPFIHTLDVSAPCSPEVLPPLEPMLYQDPDATVTTRRVAVSPLTTGRKRFVYAVDDSATTSSGTLMAFDVSPDSFNRAPLIRERAQYFFGSEPDRITFATDVSDVEFVFQDLPRPDPDTGVAVEGIQCEPHPIEFPPTTIQARYRPASDFSSGARAGLLRGTFAYAALSNGQVGVIDVEDLDAACRRPELANPSPTENLAGCANDPELPDNRFSYEPVEGVQLATVTRELSCDVVTPHYVRSATLFTNLGGVRAGLRAFPTLTLESGRAVATDQTPEGREFPKLLGAPHPGVAAETLFVGSIPYRTDETSALRLELDPNEAERNSVLLSFTAPRAFSSGEEYAAIYEGVVQPPNEGNLSVDASRGLGVLDGGHDALFCDVGVRDMEVTANVGRELGAADEDLYAFSRRHADYVQVIDELLETDDPYWSGEGARCGEVLFQRQGENSLVGRPLCEQFFGPADFPSSERDLRVVEAAEGQLWLEPRGFSLTSNSEKRRRETMEFLSCCFPRSVNYQIRAGHQWLIRGSVSGSPHTLEADPETGRCVQGCSPLAAQRNSRVFEVTCRGDDCGAVGAPRPGVDFVCATDSVEGGLAPDEPGAQCVFENLTSRFAIYRGLSPSTRDMTFRWAMGSGFSRFVQNLATRERPRPAPRELIFEPRSHLLMIPDPTTNGLMLFEPRSLAVETIF